MQYLSKHTLALGMSCVQKMLVRSDGTSPWTFAHGIMAGFHEVVIVVVSTSLRNASASRNSPISVAKPAMAKALSLSLYDAMLECSPRHLCLHRLPEISFM